MMNIRLAFLLPIAFLAACVDRAEVPPPPTSGVRTELVNVTLYRGLRVRDGTVNQIDWSRSSFGVSGNPAALSLLNINALNLPGFPCWMSFDVAVPGQGPVVPGDQGTFAFLIWPNGANPSPWTADFDNNPPGHWSILRATIGGNSNNQSSAFAADVLHDMVVNNTAQVLDGSAQGCH